MSFPSRLLNDGEHVVVTTRGHAKALIGPVLVLIVVLTAALGGASLVSGGVWYAVIAVVALGLLVPLCVVPFLRWLTTTYTFTNRRFIKRSGLLAKQGRTIPLNRISGVDFEIGVLDRLFGCGTLVVSDASTNGTVVLSDIPDVEKVQLIVSDELHRLSQGDRADDGS